MHPDRRKGADATKQFVKKNADLLPAGERVRGALLVEGKGGAWRRGIRSATLGALGDALVPGRDESGPEGKGEVASWPTSRAFWVVLTDKQLHVFAGQVGSSNVGPVSAHYPLERIAGLRFDKKLLISKLTVTFRDGTSAQLDVAKQRTRPFVDAIQARFGAG